MTPQEREKLLGGLKHRFDKHMHRHAGIAWTDVQQRLLGQPDALRALHWMEATGGEPDVIDVCGVVTDVCVLSNSIMLHTAFLHADIRVLSALCAAGTPEGHTRALTLLRGMGYTVV